MRIVKKYWLPLLALVLAIGLAVWRIGYLERTNISLSMEHVAQQGNRQQGSSAERRADHAGESGYSVQKRAVCAAERDR